ncbi:alpha,alpha-trehalase TreF [Telluribacter sp. SYSU D00476]|uniref:alpha,alpha-trehalase TreF n=1 Tax=Telluribacter sp. SYSU D00476 TaxID=2811430 RepID=UPI001FF5363F|nr:alpha,alpha-trehalase TreF [Telluribacter sp. SYSU D00476]
MKKYLIATTYVYPLIALLGLLVAPTVASGQNRTPPDELYGPLFKDVQMSRIFPDSKTFPDCTPLYSADEILDKYNRAKGQPGFDLTRFVNEHFTLPVTPNAHYGSNQQLAPADHIRQLWQVLTRTPDKQNAAGSLLPLPNAYIVPGGRFREIYYWDSYFTMLGLRESGRGDLIESMINNFAFLIDTYGHIPNGNRTYYLSRSQPPFFSLMVRLYSEIKGPGVLREYLPQMQKEYDFWMQGADSLTRPYTAHRRVVKLPDGVVLNRYWDDRPVPRPEAYREDVELAHQAQTRSGAAPEAVYRHIRAAAESGWDFSSRWFRDGKTFSTIQTTEILPVDLNCLLYHLEETLAEAYQQDGRADVSTQYRQKTEARKNAIQKYFWSATRSYYMDYDFVAQQYTTVYSLAGTYPLFFKIADSRQAREVGRHIRLEFLKSGGALTTLNRTGQQWDAPNGWAPLQWITYRGLRNYNINETAYHLRDNWLAIIEKVFRNTGKMMEKYNVSDTNLEAGGGEYPNQDGFGWTNGVYLRMKTSKK